VSLLLALAMTLGSPTRPGTYRRAAPAADGMHIAVFLYLPERPLPGAPLLVLLPDLGTTHAVFDISGEGLARELCARGLPVATLDWRGTGLSQVPPREPTLDDLLALDLPAAADALGPERPLVLVGWGYSGALAYAAAASGPLAGRVRGVVALNGVVQLDVPNAMVERLLDNGGGAVDLPRLLASPAPQRKGDLFQLLWVHGATLDDGLAARILANAMAPLSGPEASQLRAWMHAGATTLGGQPYPASLGSVKAAVLALDGMRDNWTHPEFASAVRDHLPEAQLSVQPITTFEGFDEDLGHLGLVLGPTSAKQLVPRVVRFVRERAMEGPR